MNNTARSPQLPLVNRLLQGALAPKLLTAAAVAASLVLLACQQDDVTIQDDVRIMEVTVGPELLDCVGVGPMKCMEVDGQLFYESIEGFTHEEGYSYELKIERYDAFPDEDEPPQDASRYGYRLVEVISKTAS